VSVHVQKTSLHGLQERENEKATENQQRYKEDQPSPAFCHRSSWKPLINVQKHKKKFTTAASSKTNQGIIGAATSVTFGLVEWCDGK
jgi:hypothetical protein